jgi:hypothetical protein
MVLGVDRGGDSRGKVVMRSKGGCFLIRPHFNFDLDDGFENLSDPASMNGKVWPNCWSAFGGLCGSAF